MSDNSFVIVFLDGRREKVTPRLADTVAYSMVWKKQGWPSPTEDQLLVGVFTAFAAARRQGLFSGNFDTFQNEVQTVEQIEDDEDPTEPAYTPAPTAPVADTAPTPADPPAPMAPQEPGPIGLSVEAGHSMTSPSVTTTPDGSSRHSR